MIREGLGLRGRIRINTDPRSEKETELRNKITSFLERNYVSRNTAGKKETVTKAKEKV